MSTAWIPPRRSYHLRVFAICLGLVVIALLSFLFGVQLEAVRPATGLVQARHSVELRTPVAGVVELGPAETPGEDAQERVKVGDVLEARRLVAGIAAHKLETPKAMHWLVAKLGVTHHQAVKAGDLIAYLVQVDPTTHKPREFIAEMEIAESHAGDVAVGQSVRFYSSMFTQRLHGHADGRLERIEPMGEAGPGGERKFRAVAAITQSPFPLHLGSSVRAEIVVGKKQVYKIILEQ